MKIDDSRIFFALALGAGLCIGLYVLVRFLFNIKTGIGIFGISVLYSAVSGGVGLLMYSASKDNGHTWYSFFGLGLVIGALCIMTFGLTTCFNPHFL